MSVTAGSPYSSPHAQRPAYFPPSDGYEPPRDPLVEVARLVAVTAELADRPPRRDVVASGPQLPAAVAARTAAQALVRTGAAAVAGYGRMALSYPDLPGDVLAGRRSTSAASAGRSATARRPPPGPRVGVLPVRPVLQGAPRAGRARRHPRAVAETAADAVPRARP